MLKALLDRKYIKYINKNSNRFFKDKHKTKSILVINLNCNTSLKNK